MALAKAGVGMESAVPMSPVHSSSIKALPSLPLHIPHKKVLSIVTIFNMVGGRRDHMVVGFTITYTMNTYHH